jgi:hypothetical protein
MTRCSMCKVINKHLLRNDVIIEDLERQLTDQTYMIQKIDYWLMQTFYLFLLFGNFLVIYTLLSK